MLSSEIPRLSSNSGKGAVPGWSGGSFEAPNNVPQSLTVGCDEGFAEKHLPLAVTETLVASQNAPENDREITRSGLLKTLL